MLPPLVARYSKPYVEKVIAGFLRAGKTKVLLVAASTIGLIAAIDWYVGTQASLGLFYVLPMMLAAAVLRPFETLMLACLCAYLRSLFDLPSPPLETLLRFAFAVVAYSVSGLIVTALIRNRQQAEEHFDRMHSEQELRHQVEQQLKVLVESSPAAILTLDRAGVVLACNRAANRLFLIPDGDSLQGKSIGAFIPLLADALRLDTGDGGLRTAAQCQGRRAGEIFLAHTWFSSYVTPQGPRLAAIVVDASEEMRDREEEGLRQLIRGNRIAAAAVSHEVRNLCSAISLVCSNLGQKHGIAQDEDFQGLVALADALQKIASSQLQGKVHDRLSEVVLREVLDDLRIVIEPDWREIGGTVFWDLPERLPVVLGERHGLLQAFLNLAQNSHRAVQECPVRQLRISVSVVERAANLRFLDSGPGIADPRRLFEPFQSGADGSGLGLYVSRAVIRSYGGDLRFEPDAAGTCFRVTLPIVEGEIPFEQPAGRDHQADHR
jgi:signal transduction histidine kinase